MEYKAELDEALKRKRTYNDILFKVIALIWERCAKVMQNKLLPGQTMKMKYTTTWLKSWKPSKNTR